MRSIVAAGGVLLVVVLAPGCGGDRPDGSADADAAAALLGVPWVLAAGLDVEGWQAARPSATFAGETVGGFTGCNHFTAHFTVAGDSLQLGPIAATRMACSPPADAVERAYLQALERVAGWRSHGSTLVLLDGGKKELLRYETGTPAGRWEATAIRRGEALTSPLAGTKITAAFADNGTLTGSAGCNTYRTSFTIDRGGIAIDPPAATKKACSSPDGIMAQEAAYLAALSTAARYRVEGGTLALLGADGTYVASYVRAGSNR